MNQALKVGRLTTNDETQIKLLLDHVGDMIKNINIDTPPPQIANIFYMKLREITGVFDPYQKQKQQHIQEALALYPRLKRKIQTSDNPLLTAIRIAIAGNVIDLGINKEFDIINDLEKILYQDFAIFHFDDFVKKLKNTNSILYLGDNAGESVFDKLLIEELNKIVTYVVREIPIINDVTRQEAIDSGIDEVAEIISSGTTAPGVIMELCNENFKTKFDEADFIISKGQGNYEGLSEIDKPIFFLLKAKCKMIANHLGIKENDIILKYKQHDN